MSPSWRDAFLLHAQTMEYRAALVDADWRIGDAVREATQPYVAFSGGKDSLVMLHLVLLHSPGIMVLHWDFGPYKMPRAVFAEITMAAERLGVSLRVETSAEYGRSGFNATNVFEREFFGRLEPQLAEEGYDLAFVGLRRQEAIRRRLRIDGNNQDGLIRQAWPVAQWTWMDVWAHIVSNDLPYVSVYDEVAGLVGYEHARFATFFDRDLFHMGTEAVDNVLHWKWRNGPR